MLRRAHYAASAGNGPVSGGVPVCGLGWGRGARVPQGRGRAGRLGQEGWACVGPGRRKPAEAEGREREGTCLQGLSEAVTVGTSWSPATLFRSRSSLGRRCRASEPSGPAESESAFGQGHRGFLCTVRLEKYRRNSRLPTFIWDAFSCEDKNPTQTSPSIKKRLISSGNQTEKAGCY